MYIIHPKWLARHQIIEKGQVGILFNLAQPGFRFVPTSEKMIWNVAPDRVSVESADPEVDCGAKIAAVLQTLPHTPLIAIGNNAVYQADLSQIDALAQPVRDFLQARSPDPQQTLAQRSFHVALRQGERQITNLQVSVKDEGIEVLCNVHTELGNREEFNQAAVEAAGRFFQDRAATQRWVHHFFAVELEHASDNRH